MISNNSGTTEAEEQSETIRAEDVNDTETYNAYVRQLADNAKDLYNEHDYANINEAVFEVVDSSRMVIYHVYRGKALTHTTTRLNYVETQPYTEGAETTTQKIQGVDFGVLLHDVTAEI